jgi:hypothetical protein
MTELEILKARVVHLERTLRLRESENQRLRSLLREPTTPQVNRRDLIREHKGVEQ